MTKKARSYNAEEKAKIAIEAIKGELTIAQISSKFGVHSTQIHHWKKQAIENMVSGFRSGVTRTAPPDQQELVKQLYEQIGQLSVERDWLKKNLQYLDLADRRKMINSVVELNIARQCDLLGISRSCYYYKPRAYSARDLEIMRIIDETYTQHPYYGTRRMSKYLQSEGYDIGRKATRSYYRIMALEAVYPKKNLSKRNHAHKVYPYLLKDVEITRVNQVWSADITYIRLSQGFVYLVAIIDWYSRYILSWHVSISLESEFCVSALEEALEKYGKPEIFNTGQGVQFTSNDFINTLTQHNIQISMDGRGRALDNIFIERFWRSLKQEKIYLIILTNVKEAKNAIHDYMIFYNTKRMHQSLNYNTTEFVYLLKN